MRYDRTHKYIFLLHKILLNKHRFEILFYEAKYKRRFIKQTYLLQRCFSKPSYGCTNHFPKRTKSRDSKQRSIKLCRALKRSDRHSYDNPLSQEPCSLSVTIINNEIVKEVLCNAVIIVIPYITKCLHSYSLYDVFIRN